MRAWLALWLLLLLLASSASADASRERVAIDWQGVSDRDIQRCGLSRLRAGVIERLVSDGYALVESVDATGVSVALRSSAQGLAIRVSSGETQREDELRPGEACDATFVLDVIGRVAELVAEVVQARPAPAQPAVVAAPSVAPQPELERAERDETTIIAALDVTGRANQALSWLAGGGLSTRVQLASGLQIGGRAEVAGSAHLEVTVMELFGALTAAYQPDDALIGPCLELGPVVHLASSDARSVTELDASLAGGLQLSAGHFLAQLLVYGRLRDFEHRVGSEIAHDSGRVGLALRFGAQL